MAINLAGLRGDQVVHKPGFELCLGFVRIFGPGLWALFCLGLLNRGAKPKAMVPTMPPFFQLGRSVFPDWKNTIF